MALDKTNGQYMPAIWIAKRGRSQGLWGYVNPSNGKNEERKEPWIK